MTENDSNDSKITVSPWASDHAASVAASSAPTATDGTENASVGSAHCVRPWQDPEDLASDTWRFAGQTTVCKSAAAQKCNNRSAGDAPTYLQLWASRNGSHFEDGFEALGNLFPFEPNNEPDEGIMNVPGACHLK